MLQIVAKKTRNKILGQVNTQDFPKSNYGNGMDSRDNLKFNPYFWLISHYTMLIAKSRV